MTMEVILSTAFGRSLDVQGGNGGKLFEAAVAVFNALAPPKEGDAVNVFRMLQFVLSKLHSLCIATHIMSLSATFKYLYSFSCQIVATLKIMRPYPPFVCFSVFSIPGSSCTAHCTIYGNKKVCRFLGQVSGKDY